MADKFKLLIEREHDIISTRSDQLKINELGWHGGRNYIDYRLSRFAAESDIDWNGGRRSDGSTVTGRKSRAYVVPYLTRIVDKINDYVFSQKPIRTGITPEIELDITSEGKSLDNLMIDVSSLLTVHGWCWIGVDAPVIPPDYQISITDKIKNKIRPYAQVYKANDVVDWYYTPDGTLQWLLTDSFDYIAEDPYQKPYYQHVRRLYEPGKVTKINISEDNVIESVEEIGITLTDRVPFVLCGQPSSDPNIFDNLESIFRAMLDLSSANFASYYNCVYPQMYLPASVLDTVMSSYNVTAQEATTMIKGFSYPILLSETDQVPGYMMPDSGSIETMRNELKELKNELYESVGMLLRKESRQAESAEAKVLDQLDLNMLVRSRAEKLENIENELSTMMNSWDKEIPEYTVDYNKEILGTEVVDNPSVEDFVEQNR